MWLGSDPKLGSSSFELGFQSKSHWETLCHAALVHGMWSTLEVGIHLHPTAKSSLWVGFGTAYEIKLVFIFVGDRERRRKEGKMK